MQNLQELKEIASNLSVLYIEDDISIQKSMLKYLNKFFSSVTSAYDGIDGLEKFEKNNYDIVITDLSMPKMNGIDMINKIKEINENQAILITTAYSESNYLLGAIKAHVDGYIIKPFDYNELNYELFKVSQKIQKFKENELYKNHLQTMVEQQTQMISENYEKTLYSMVELIEQRDTYTAGHSKRVAHYAKMIAQEMGYSEEECTLIHQAGILHDIGKIGTPDSVLLNPKKLNQIEYKLIQEHVTVGYKLLKNIPMFKPLANIIYSHHERYDGHGYPNGLKGNDIEPMARILIICDAFDAMTTNRIYKTRKTVAEAIEDLKELSEKQFHPDIVPYAIKVLQNVIIDENITQLPQTKLEEERFAYFYKDTLSTAFNQNYLDVILMTNSYEYNYKAMSVFFIHNFSQYNKIKGWQNGNDILKNIGDMLVENLHDTLVFRIFGDDFAIISKEPIQHQKIENILDAIIGDDILSYEIMDINLQNQKIERLSDIDILQN